MTYTIRIKSSSSKAQSIINMLKELREEFDFIDIIEEDDSNDVEEMSSEFLNELDMRSEYMHRHPEEGKDWEEVKKKLSGE